MDDFPRSPAALAYQAAEEWAKSPSVAGAAAAVLSVVTSVSQFFLICGSPRILLFHASDATPADGAFTRFDRLVFVAPALVAIVVGSVALRLRGPRGVSSVGILLGFASLLMVSGIGFSK